MGGCGGERGGGVGVQDLINKVDAAFAAHLDEGALQSLAKRTRSGAGNLWDRLPSGVSPDQRRLELAELVVKDGFFESADAFEPFAAELYRLGKWFLVDQLRRSANLPGPA